MTPPPPDASAAAVPPGPIARQAPLVKRTLTAALAERGYFGLAAARRADRPGRRGVLLWKVFQQTGAAWSTFGVWGFITGPGLGRVARSPGTPVFGALPMIYGTVLTSVIAMAIAVPVAVGVALATTFIPSPPHPDPARRLDRPARRGAVGRVRPVGHRHHGAVRKPGVHLDDRAPDDRGVRAGGDLRAS